MTSGMFVPTAAMKARMMTVPGSDSTISLTRFIDALAARGCATAHSVTGTVIAHRDDRRRCRPIASVEAAAVTMRESRSRPSSSVPSRCAGDGPCSTAVRSCSSGP